MKTIFSLLIILSSFATLERAHADSLVDVCPRGAVGKALSQQLRAPNCHEVSADKMAALTSLDVSRSYTTGETSIPDNAFEGLIKVNYLDVDIPEMRQVPTVALRALPSLGRVTIRGKITKIRKGDFAGFSSTVWAVGIVSASLIDVEDGSFADLVSLRRLDLSDNQLSMLTPGIFAGLGRLEILNLANDKINILTDGVFQSLPNLEQLFLDDNPLNIVSSNAFVGLSKLVRLDMKRSNIIKLGQNVFAPLIKLELLNLMSSGLGKIVRPYVGLTSNPAEIWGVTVGSKITPPLTISQLVAGDDFTCALSVERGVECFGGNPGVIAVPLLKVPTQIAAGAKHVCALTSDGVQCWGDNSQDQLNVPKTLSHVTQLTAGGAHSCALSGDGRAICWGSNLKGQLAIPTDLTGIQQLSLGNDHSCALTSAGKVRCWGGNEDGQSTVPVNLPKVTQIAAAANFTCVVANGLPQCWGVAVEFSTFETFDINVKDLKNPTQIKAGSYNYSLCALDDNGVQCGGYDYNLPIGARVPYLNNPSQLAVGNFHACAVTDDGIKCWGDAMVPENLYWGL